MGKKNRTLPAGKPAVPVSSPVFLNKLIATAQQTAPLINTPSPEWNEGQLRELFADVPSAVQQRFSSFVDQFATFGTLMQSGVKALHDLRGALSSEKDAQARDRATLDTQRECQAAEQRRVAELLAEAHSAQEQLDAQRAEVIRKEQELLIQEATLRGGLIAERAESLRVLRDQIESLEHKRDRISVEAAEARERILDLARADAAMLTEVARKRAEALQAEEVELASRAQEQGRREERLRLNEELLRVGRSSAVDAVREELEQTRLSAEERIDRLGQRLTKKSEEVDRLNLALDELEELRANSGGDPRVLLEELDQLRREVREKDRELQDARMRLSSDDPAELKGQRDLFLEKVRQLDAEVASLRSQEGNWRRSVTEREDWERARAAMERSRSVLHEQNDRLRRDVEELLDKKQSESAFPALAAMDRALSVPAQVDPVPPLKQLVKELRSRIAYSGDKGKVLHYSDSDIQLFLGGLAMSQLHILQGISGTGKTSLAMAFAKAVGGHCTPVAVQAGWRDRNDLLGYYNAFEKKYYERNTLQALYRAQTPEWRDRINIVLLDEMNLSRPEQYFAEFLSALEMGESDRWINLLDSPVGGMVPELLRDGRDIHVPGNVWFIGTANQDETTNGFADKTHDRAFVMELHKSVVDDAGLIRPDQGIRWSVSSIKSQFEKAGRLWVKQVDELLQFINDSTLTRLLSDEWHLAWGNRFEAQFRRFVPVVLESGGSEAMAVDHMLHSRMFRDGKVVGRHDMTPDDLTRVEAALIELWEECQLDGEPVRCLQSLTRDRQRMGRGG